MASTARIRVRIGGGERAAEVISSRPGQLRCRFVDGREAWINESAVLEGDPGDTGASPASARSDSFALEATSQVNRIADRSPYAPPSADTKTPRRAVAWPHQDDTEALKRIAAAHRWVISGLTACFAAFFLMFVAIFVTRGVVRQSSMIWVMAPFLAVIAVGSITQFVGLLVLAYRLRGAGSVVAVLFVSLIGLGVLALVLLHLRASRVLKAAGYPVGFLGVPASEFD